MNDLANKGSRWLLGCCLSGLSALVCAGETTAHDDRAAFCSRTAQAVFNACGFETADEFWLARANCINVADAADRAECWQDAREALREGRAACREQRDARLDLCERYGEARYTPVFEPDNFVDPETIGTSVAPNPYFPLVVGNGWVYAKTVIDDEGDEVVETVRVTVTDRTKLIEGVTCREVHDVAREDGQVIEDTDDWYAQDHEGNVWYCGELARNYATYAGDRPEDPELVDIEGSWKAGRDAAKPGIVVLALPRSGDIVRQEMALGDAEDVAEIVDTAASETTPAASCAGTCVETREYTPIEPDVFERKYYAPGIGQILSVDSEGNREELVELITP